MQRKELYSTEGANIAKGVGAVATIFALLGFMALGEKIHDAVIDSDDPMVTLESSLLTFFLAFTFTAVGGLVWHQGSKQLAARTSIDEDSFEWLDVSRYDPMAVRLFLYGSAVIQTFSFLSVDFIENTDASAEDIATAVVLTVLLWAICLTCFERYLAPRAKADCYDAQFNGNFPPQEGGAQMQLNAYLEARGFHAEAGDVVVEAQVLSYRLSADEERQVYGAVVPGEAEGRLRALMALCQTWTTGVNDSRSAQLEADEREAIPAIEWPPSMADRLLVFYPEGPKRDRVVQYLEGVIANYCDADHAKKRRLLQGLASYLTEEDPNIAHLRLLRGFLNCRRQTVSDSLLAHLVQTVETALETLAKHRPIGFPKADRGQAAARVMRLLFANVPAIQEAFDEPAEDTSFSRHKDAAFHQLFAHVSDRIRAYYFTLGLDSDLASILSVCHSSLQDQEDNTDKRATLKAANARLKALTGRDFAEWVACAPVPSANPYERSEEGFARCLIDSVIRTTPLYNQRWERRSDYHREISYHHVTPEDVKTLAREEWAPDHVQAYLVDQNVLGRTGCRSDAFYLGYLLSDAVCRVQLCAQRDGSTGQEEEGRPPYWDELDRLLQLLTGHTLEECKRQEPAVTTDHADGDEKQHTATPRILILPPTAADHERNQGGRPWVWERAIESHLEPKELAGQSWEELSRALTFGEPLSQQLQQALDASSTAATSELSADRR